MELKPFLLLVLPDGSLSVEGDIFSSQNGRVLSGSMRDVSVQSKLGLTSKYLRMVLKACGLPYANTGGGGLTVSEMSEEKFKKIQAWTAICYLQQKPPDEIEGFDRTLTQPMRPAAYQIRQQCYDQESRPSPYTVVIDTRERTPYQFSKNFMRDRSLFYIQAITKSLPTGDYSIVGHESEIAVERKSLADFLGTAGQGRRRFERELGRLAKMKFAAVVIEAEWSQILYTRDANLLIHELKRILATGAATGESDGLGLGYIPGWSGKFLRDKLLPWLEKLGGDYPSRFSRMDPKIAEISVMTWQQQFPNIHWWAMPGRDAAEETVIRLLDQWWLSNPGQSSSDFATLEAADKREKAVGVDPDGLNLTNPHMDVTHGKLPLS